MGWVGLEWMWGAWSKEVASLMHNIMLGTRVLFLDPWEQPKANQRETFLGQRAVELQLVAD